MPQTIDLRQHQEAPTPQDHQSDSAMATSASSSEVEAVPLRWTTHHTPPSKDRAWYIGLVLIASGILVLVLAHDVLFSVILFLGSLIVLATAHQPHKPTEISIHATGVSLNEEYLHFADMKSFWIHYEPGLKALSIELKRTFAPRVHIPLENSDPLSVRRAMITYVPERKHELSFVEHLAHLLEH